MSRQTDLQDDTRKTCDSIHRCEKDMAWLSLPVQDDASHTLPRRHFEPELIHIPAGDCLFGYELNQEYLPDYYIARTPTTNIQYL